MNVAQAAAIGGEEVVGGIVIDQQVGVPNVEVQP